MMIREPAVAGSFYPHQAAQLKAELSGLLDLEGHNPDAIGIVVPHAGYVFSAKVAAMAYRSVAIPQKVLLLGPDHRGRVRKTAVFASGAWNTPLGEVPIAESLARHLLATCDQLEADETGHRFEHSIEVQIPFLQYLRPDVQILPISLGQASLAEWLHLGHQLGQSLSDYDDQVLLLASSDMNHFKPALVTEQIDRRAIEIIEKFAPEELYTLVRKENISMCGVTAVTVMLEAARTLGATSCQLLDYNHSGTINGDMDSVVGYASFLVT